jgi:hypothetical protein
LARGEPRGLRVRAAATHPLEPSTRPWLARAILLNTRSATLPERRSHAARLARSPRRPRAGRPGAGPDEEGLSCSGRSRFLRRRLMRFHLQLATVLGGRDLRYRRVHRWWRELPESRST